MRSLLLALLLAGCSAHVDPIDVLGDYLEAEQQGRYAKAHELLSADDQAVRSLDAYITEHLQAGPVWRAVAASTAFHVEEVQQTEERVTVQITAVHPQMRAVAEGVPPVPTAQVEASDDPEALIYALVRETLATKTFPTASERLTYQLVPQDRGWRVWLGLRHADEAVRLGAQALVARQSGDTAAELVALRAALELPLDAGGGVELVQTQARERLAQLAEAEPALQAP
jgi:hypothetical protein